MFCAPRVDDRFLAAQKRARRIDGDEVRIATVGDVLDQARRQAEQRAVGVDGAIEVAPRSQVGAGEHQVADAAVAERERLVGPPVFLEERREPVGDARVRRSAERQRRSASTASAWRDVSREPRVEQFDQG